MSMKPSVALSLNHDAVRETLSRYPVTNPRVFGSVARGRDRDGSDLDLLVDTLPGTTLADLGELVYDLSVLLGVEVDLRTTGELSPKWRARVMAEVRPL